MTIDKFTTFMASISTFIASIVVIFTLLEMKKQRKSAVKPEIVIMNSWFYLYWKKQNNICMPRIPSLKKLERKDIENTLEDHHLKLNLHNIGIGAAKNVEIRWDYKAKEYINKIIELDSNNIFDIEYKENKQFGLLIKKPFKEMINTRSEVNKKHDYILTSSIVKDPLEVRIPTSYTALWSILCYLNIYKWMNDENTKTPKIHNIEESPEVRLFINYDDIANNKYKKEFILKMHMISTIIPNKFEKDPYTIEPVIGSIDVLESSN